MLNELNQIPAYARRTQARQQQQSETIAKPPTEEEIHQRFQKLPQSEQARINSLPPAYRLTALRQLATQPTQTAQATPQESITPEKLAIAESFARTLPIRQRLELENLSGTKRLERTWEIKEYFDRTGRLPGS